MLPTFLSRLVALNLRRSRIERRRGKRLAPGQPTPCLLKVPGAADGDPAWLHNLSLRGAGILTSREHELGTTLQVLLVNAAHMYSLPVEFTVVRTGRAANGDYFLGGHFARPLRSDELMPFLV
jgi:hypothetical protein